MGLGIMLVRFMPRAIRSLAIRWREDRIQRKYAELPLADTFDRVYESNAWGGKEGSTLNSGSGSTGRYVDEYCTLLKALLAKHKVNSIADLGCGDFNTGRVVAEFVTDYTGVDVAQPIIDANTRAYASDTIRFIRADLTRDTLPPADAAIVRQVLQHLSNSEIRGALDNIARTYKLAMITEHIYIGPNSKPNLDMPHGPGTRVPMRSGVFLDSPPFGQSATAKGDIECGPGEVLRTWVIETRRAVDRADSEANGEVPGESVV